MFTAAEADDAASASSASSPESVSGQSEAAPGHARSDAARGRGRKKKRHRDRKLVCVWAERARRLAPDRPLIHPCHPPPQAYTTVGTPDYIAPEVLSHKGYGKEVGPCPPCDAPCHRLLTRLRWRPLRHSATGGLWA